ncbi:NosD domain-containing protein [Chloroflexota bacterium]
MKRKIFSVLVTLMLVLSFSLVTALPVSAATINVPGDHATIQAAIDAASSGDTILVGDGTYISGTIHVHTVENLTIESVGGAATTFITGDAGTDKMFEIGGHSGNTADGFTLDGFTLNGVYSYGVYMYISDFDIKNNIITGTKSDGIVVTNPTTGPPTAITSGAITNNTITGLGASILNDYRPGILLEANDAAGAAISGITITDNTVTGFGTTTVGVEAAGIRMASVEGNGVTSDITVTGNTMSGNHIGLHIYGACTGLTITDNTMTANSEGVALQNSGTTDLSSTFDMDENTITNNTDHGVHIIKTAAEALSGAKNIRYNTITGNGVGITNDFGAGTAPVATNNWWGSANGPEHSGNTFNVGSQGDAVTDIVDYVPWYDTDMTGTSFAPVWNTTDSIAFSSIGGAIAAGTTASGETITAVTGDYEEDVVINKALTLTGRNLADTANAWTVGTAGTSSGPTIVDDAAGSNDFVQVASDNVTIQGFNIDASTFTGMNAGIYWDGTTRSDTTIQYCTLDADNGDRLINLADSSVAYDLIITYNDFTIDEGAWGNWFGMGVNGGTGLSGNTANVISYNTAVGSATKGLTCWLDLGTNHIGDITWANNDLDYGIVLNETSEQSTGKYGDLVLQTNTFGGTHNTSTSAFEVAATVENTDWEGGSLTADDVIIHYNDFGGYAVGGNATIQVASAATSDIDAMYNYWGDSLTGPYHATDNPSGIDGDVDADDVDYRPWIYKTTAANDGDTVANIVDNEVSAYANAVDLSTGWNTFSVPIALDGQSNTWAELYTLTSLDYSLAYRFDVSSQTFVSLGTTSTYALAPGEGLYVKMDSVGSIPYAYSTVISIPSRDLEAGWNLIGGGLTTQDEVITCVSIATVGSTAGYTQIISTAENASSWLWTTGLGTQGDFVLGEGYWAFLPIDRTLGLFDPTPVAWAP